MRPEIASVTIMAAANFHRSESPLNEETNLFCQPIVRR